MGRAGFRDVPELWADVEPQTRFGLQRARVDGLEFRFDGDLEARFQKAFVPGPLEEMLVGEGDHVLDPTRVYVTTVVETTAECKCPRAPVRRTRAPATQARRGGGS